MKSINKTIFTVAFVLSGLAYAENRNPIDIQLNTCLSKQENMNTAGMANCTNMAAESWDKELNKVYKGLMAKLESKGQENLKKSQIAWLKYRDLEYKNIGSVYAQLQGTMHIPERAMSVLLITKNRTLELQGYLTSLSL